MANCYRSSPVAWVNLLIIWALAIGGCGTFRALGMSDPRDGC